MISLILENSISKSLQQLEPKKTQEKPQQIVHPIPPKSKSKDVPKPQQAKKKVKKVKKKDEGETGSGKRLFETGEEKKTNCCRTN